MRPAKVPTNDAPVCPNLPKRPRHILWPEEPLFAVACRPARREAIHVHRHIDGFFCEPSRKLTEPLAPVLLSDTSPPTAPRCFQPLRQRPHANPPGSESPAADEEV